MSLTDNVFIVTLGQECTQVIRIKKSFTFYIVNYYLVIYNLLYSLFGRTIILLCFFKGLPIAGRQLFMLNTLSGDVIQLDVPPFFGTACAVYCIFERIDLHGTLDGILQDTSFVCHCIE